MTAACRRVAEFPDPYPKPSTSVSRLEMGFWESSWLPYVCEYAEVSLVRCRSRCSKIFMTLRSATSSSSSTLVRERNPHFSVHEGACPNSYHYSITNREVLGHIRCCIARKSFVICTKPQQWYHSRIDV
jgi:hypothetical protein